VGSHNLDSRLCLTLGLKASAPPLSNQPIIKLPIGKVDKVGLPDGYAAGFNIAEYIPGSGMPLPNMIYTTLPQAIGQSSDEPVTECFLYCGSKDVLTSLPGYPTRALSTGDLILCERPLLITVFVQFSLNVNEKALSDVQAFMKLANSHTTDGSGPLFGIVRTNGLGISGLRPGVKGELGMYTAICNYISRLNHSCSPNTQPFFDKVSLSYRLYAVRDIAVGEELTFQYIDRNKALKPYAFVCTCPSCTDATASNARRAAIAAFIPTVAIWAVNRTLSDDWLLDKCREQIALIETEGLEHLTAYFDATKAVMEAYICLGDARNASKWAAKLNKMPLLDPANAAYEAHHWWRMRVGDARPGSVGNMFQQLASLAGPNGITTLPNGTGMIMFPGLFP
ncbi:hypothetical protein B0H13DRAFT_1949543, partial [Mycena leptocephala]